NLHDIKVPNYLFRNEGDLRFTDVSDKWGFNNPGYAYGVAHGDLNNNGTLDVVMNNLNAPASIYQNNGAELHGNNFLMVELKGDSLNKQGIGTEIILTVDGKKQYQYQTLWRGYQSTVDSKLHFGLGQATGIDSLEVIWPDGQYQLLKSPKLNQTIILNHQESGRKPLLNSGLESANQIFTDVTGNTSLKYKHEQNESNDYRIQPLLPYQLSKLGPHLAVGDVTNNGLDDVYIGGAAGKPGTLFIQQEDGSFIESPHNHPWIADRDHEDMGALFFDANGNGLQDLYVTSGGYQFSPASDLLMDRLYINHGDGRFLRDISALPQMRTSTASVTAGDFTGNGEMDLFVGGRLSPRNYPLPTRSYLLRNDGGIFIDITIETIPDLFDPGGMITDAVWIDFNNNGLLDLVTVGIWMPVQFFENKGGKLQNVTNSMDLPPMRGWWYSLEKADLNQNGYPDLIVGNLGLNHDYKTSDESKFGVYANDFSGNRTTDIV
ncbi:MAG: VCBS repeat-containing protein, partial [Balneolales bacterium]